jgi:hypothetical protein
MATCTLTKTWTNLVSSGVGVSGAAAVGRTEDYTASGDVRTYVGGRRRAIAVIGEVGTFKFQYRYVPRSTVDTLHAWITKLVQVRDARGRRFFGVYFDLAIDDVTTFASFCPPEISAAAGGAWHVGINLTLVTATEMV